MSDDEASKEEKSEKEEPSPTQVNCNHYVDDVIGVLNEGRKTPNKQINFEAMVKLVCIISLIEPNNMNDALDDEFWTHSMHEELENFTKLDVWDLCPKPKGVNVVGTKRI